MLFLGGLVSRTLFVAFETTTGRLGVSKRCFRKESIAKINFLQKSLLSGFWVFFFGFSKGSVAFVRFLGDLSWA